MIVIIELYRKGTEGGTRFAALPFDHPDLHRLENHYDHGLIGTSLFNPSAEWERIRVYEYSEKLAAIADIGQPVRWSTLFGLEALEREMPTIKAYVEGFSLSCVEPKSGQMLESRVVDRKVLLGDVNRTEEGLEEENRALLTLGDLAIEGIDVANGVGYLTYKGSGFRVTTEDFV